VTAEADPHPLVASQEYAADRWASNRRISSFREILPEANELWQLCGQGWQCLRTN
jgi:hypothetical protein